MPNSGSASESNAMSPGFKAHFIRQGDGQGGWILKPAECQILRYRERGWTGGFGLAQMDNGEVVLMGVVYPSASLWYGAGWEKAQTIIAFSSDHGNTWTDLKPVLDAPCSCRPVTLAYLGGGNLTYFSDKRYFSSDYGRTWSSVPLQFPSNSRHMENEGNPLIERDERGMATLMAEIVFNGKVNLIRWSDDRCRTWRDELSPAEWRGSHGTRSWQATEGALVRARNGWLVAALRTPTPVPYPGPQSDQYRSTRVSISEDEGKTWSAPQRLFDGRMHAHLLRMADGDIVMTVTVRHDIDNGKLVSYRKGCEAVVSHDNGLTWDLDRRYILDEWVFYDALSPAVGQCGHLYSTLLDDGSILSVHNNNLTMGMTLIRWRP